MTHNVNIKITEQYLLKIYDNYATTIDENVDLRLSLKEIEENLDNN